MLLVGRINMLKCYDNTFNIMVVIIMAVVSSFISYLYTDNIYRYIILTISTLLIVIYAWNKKDTLLFFLKYKK